MNTNETAAAFIITEHGAMDDADDESFGAHLGDNDILMAFLSDGCDLDGTPLLMVDEISARARPSHEVVTLH